MYLFFFSHGIHGDAAVRYDALLVLLQTGKLSPMVYSYVHPLISSPLLLLGYIVKSGFWWISRFNAFVFLGTAFYLAHHFKKDRQWSPESTRLALLLFFAATMFPKHVTDYYPEVFSTCLALLGMLWIQENKPSRAILAICLSVWNVIATLPAAALVFVFFAIRKRSWRYLAAIPLLVVGFALENYLKYDDWYPHAYLNMQIGPKSVLPYAEGPGFSYPLFFGILNVFFSFGRGLLFFCPGIIALFYSGLWKNLNKDREIILAGLIYLIGLVVVYGRFWGWHAGYFWGPRYFLFVSLLSCLALLALSREEQLSLKWRSLWVLTVGFSLWVACQGVLFGNDFLEDCGAKDLDFMCIYTPEYSVLWRMFIIGPPMAGRRIAFLIYFVLVGGSVLWSPVKILLGEFLTFAKSTWRDHGPTSNWRF